MIESDDRESNSLGRTTTWCSVTRTEREVLGHVGSRLQSGGARVQLSTKIRLPSFVVPASGRCRWLESSSGRFVLAAYEFSALCMHRSASHCQKYEPCRVLWLFLPVFLLDAESSFYRACDRQCLLRSELDGRSHPGSLRTVDQLDSRPRPLLKSLSPVVEKRMM